MNINNVLEYLEEIKDSANYIYERSDFSSQLEQAADTIRDSVSRIEAEMRDIDG